MEIDMNKVEYGDAHGSLYNFFKNIYYDKRYVGRTYDRSTFLEEKEKTVIIFCGKPWLTEKQIKILEQSGCVLDDTAECDEKDYPYIKEFLNDEEGALKWFGEMIDKLEMDFEYFYPQEEKFI